MQQKYIISKQKKKKTEKTRYPLRLGSISKDFTANNMKKKTTTKNKKKHRIKCILVQFFCWLRYYL